MQRDGVTFSVTNIFDTFVIGLGARCQTDPLQTTGTLMEPLQHLTKHFFVHAILGAEIFERESNLL